MSTAVSSTSPATASSKFASWRKARKLEHQSRNVASRQLKGSRLVLRYITLVVVAILSVFYGSAELTSNIASGLIGFLGRTVMMRGEKEGAR